jgi:hypothetical protein
VTFDSHKSPSSLAHLAWAFAFVLFACLQLVGCSIFDGGMGHRGSSAPTVSKPSHVRITVRSRCNHPVEVCYGTKEKCSTLKPGERREVHGQGAGLPVRLKANDASVSADSTFSLVEVDDSCTRISRLLPDDAPESDGTVH